MKKIFVLLISLFTLQSVMAQKIVGYIPQYRTIEQMDAAINWGSMTDAFYFGSTPSTAGGINLEAPEKFEHVKQRAKENDVKCWLSIGGWNKSASFGPLAANSTARQTFAQNCIDFCATHGLAGVDIDWEFPTSTQKGDVKLLLKAVYEAFEADGRGFELSAAVGGEEGHTENWDPESFQYLHHVNVMAYDAPTTYDNHSSLKFLQDAMDNYHEQGCPYEKMLGGVAFYSRPSVQMYSTVLNNSSNKQNTFESDGTGGIKYNGKNTIEAKIDYVMGKGGLGVLIWELTQDVKDGPYSLLNATYKKMEEYMCPLPRPELGEAASICGSSSVTLDAGATAPAGSSYKWYKDDVLINGATSRTYNAPSAGVYEVEITDGSCANSDKVEVLGVLPSINLGDDINLCDPATAILDASLTGNGITFLWEKDDIEIDGATDATLQVDREGTYTVIASASGCSSTSASVNVTSELVNVEHQSIACKGSVTFSILDDGSFEWYDVAEEGSPLSSDKNFTTNATETKTYYVQKLATAQQAPSNTGCDGLNEWVAQTYAGSTEVSYNGIKYRNKWYASASDVPGVGNGGSTPWEVTGECSGISCQRTPVTVTVENGGVCTSAEVNTLETYINIRPNPVTNLARVSFGTEGNSEATLQIVNTQGQVVYSTNVNTVSGINQVEINTSNLAPGIYICQVATNGQVITSRFTK
ncbi:MAG: T9SS type A sorting domain-containing protein [Cytophagales bacterium]|nr:T9SS type A sorting domain-containing protein [Cytophagales bacterium]